MNFLYSSKKWCMALDKSEVAVWSPIDHALTALQCSHPTLGNFLPPVSVEVFPSRDALDIYGLF